MGEEYDGSLLYEDRLLDIFREHSNSEKDEIIRKVETSRRALREMLKTAGASLVPTAYFVTLLADGDTMGKFISEQCTTREHHADFSRHLERWASGCRRIIQYHEGSLIYAGGDDVLALLPLDTALLAARELRESFLEAMANAARAITAAEDARRPTLSVGLAITHHLQPMRDGLELARKAEATAKNAGRDALAILCQKRSGGLLAASEKWGNGLDKRIPEWGKLFDGEALPDKVAFAFKEAVSAFDREHPPSTELLKAILQRALGRRRAHRGGAELDEAMANKLAQALYIDEDAADNETARSRKLMQRIGDLSHELQLARLFQDAYREAQAQ